MKILAIETSCDETGVAILESPRAEFGQSIEILSNLVASQISVHRRWGGVVPNLARREHQRNLIPLLSQSLRETKTIKPQWRWALSSREQKIISESLNREPRLSKELTRFLKRWTRPEIDLLAVTIGPGLEPALWTGANLTLALSRIWQIPFVPVNHVEAHIVANWLGDSRPQEWPVIALVVSGGHTELILMENSSAYRIIGRTRDDAAGECFDKTARVLDLGYPGGPIISKLAEEWRVADQEKAPAEVKEISLPRPMIGSRDYDFSFSGLKTAVLYRHQSYPERIKRSPYYKIKMAAEIEDAINDVLINKTIEAAKQHQAKTILIGGGVAANRSLRHRLTEQARESGFNLFIPPVKFCTDNAAMIGLTGLKHSKKASLSDTIKVNANLNL